MINLAIVGLGRFGRRHVEAAVASGRFRVVSAVVRNREKAEAYARENGITLSTDLAATLADPGVDAVSIVTPHTQHTAQIIQAAAAGKHVLAEKPFALTKADADRAIEACAKAGVVVAVGHDNRFYAVIAEIKKAIAAGTLGSISHVEANLSHRGAQSGPATWRRDSAEGPVGPITHLGIHRIDTFVQLFGRIDEVFAQSAGDASRAPTSVAVLLRFGSGMTGYLGSSQLTPLNSRMQIFGSEAWLEARGAHDIEEYRRSSFRRISVRHQDGSFDTRRIEPVDSVMLNFAAFADAIEGKSPYPIAGDEIVHVVAVVEAIGRSLASRQPSPVERSAMA